ncbi:phosphotransferase enzyme family protein [Bacillus infantis]|uniref:phosphotransferase enzyme family protein n=1 Tax=Bacillus infantis TaxID=324767 RepID=UPI003CF8C92B
MNRISAVESQFRLKITKEEELTDRVALLHSEDGKRYILKKTNGMCLEREAELLQNLEGKGIPAHQLISALDGSSSFIYSEEQYSLYTYCKGKNYKADEVLISEKAPQLLASAIAAVHAEMDKIQIGYPEKDLYKTVYGFAVPEVMKSPLARGDSIKEIIAAIEPAVRNLSDTLPRQLIHRDAHFYNILFEEGKFSGMIDFEIAVVSHRIFDICYCATSVLCEIFDKEAKRGLWVLFSKKLFSHYGESIGLLAREKKHLWDMMLCIQLIFMAYFSKNKELFTLNAEMLVWIFERREEWKQI